MRDYDILPFPYKNAATKEIDQNDPMVVRWRYIICGVLATVIIPINYQRNLGALRYFSMAIVLIMLYTISVD